MIPGLGRAGAPSEAWVERPLGVSLPPITLRHSGHLKSCFFPMGPIRMLLLKTCIHIEIRAPKFQAWEEGF